MKVVRWLAILVVIAMIGLFGYSYIQNPNMGPSEHAKAVGFVLANPASTAEWQGLACPHRRAVINLVTMSMAPQVCGTPNDGGAMQRAKKFQTQGLGSCWALFEVLSTRAKDEWGPYISKKKPRDNAVNSFCKQAQALIKKAG